MWLPLNSAPGGYGPPTTLFLFVCLHVFTNGWSHLQTAGLRPIKADSPTASAMASARPVCKRVPACHSLNATPFSIVLQASLPTTMQLTGTARYRRRAQPKKRSSPYPSYLSYALMQLYYTPIISLAKSSYTVLNLHANMLA